MRSLISHSRHIQVFKRRVRAVCRLGYHNLNFHSDLPQSSRNYILQKNSTFPPAFRRDARLLILSRRFHRLPPNTLCPKHLGALVSTRTAYAFSFPAQNRSAIFACVPASMPAMKHPSTGAAGRPIVNVASYFLPLMISPVAPAIAEFIFYGLAEGLVGRISSNQKDTFPLDSRYFRRRRSGMRLSSSRIPGCRSRTAEHFQLVRVSLSSSSDVLQAEASRLLG